MTSGVYSITNTTTGRRYIGKSSNITVRLSLHRSQLRAGKHYCTTLQADWTSFGEAAFQFETVAKLPESEIGAAECALIAEALAAGACYNSKMPGLNDGRPTKPVDERLVRRTVFLNRPTWEFIDALGYASFREKIDGWDPTATIAEQEAYWSQP